MTKAFNSKQSGTFVIGGLDTRGGIAKVGQEWCNIVYAENHFFVPAHLWKAGESKVEITTPDKQVFNYDKQEGRKVMHDMVAFKFKPSAVGVLAPPSMELRLPNMDDPEVMIVSYKEPADLYSKKLVISHGKVSKIELTKGKEMVSYTAETYNGQSGAMCINKACKVVGFHNEVGGFLPVTVELLAQIRSPKN